MQIVLGALTQPRAVADAAANSLADRCGLAGVVGSLAGQVRTMLGYHRAAGMLGRLVAGTPGARCWCFDRSGLVKVAAGIGVVELLPDLVLLLVWQTGVVIVPAGLNFGQAQSGSSQLMHKLLVGTAHCGGFSFLAFALGIGFLGVV